MQLLTQRIQDGREAALDALRRSVTGRHLGNVRHDIPQLHLKKKAPLQSASLQI